MQIEISTKGIIYHTVGKRFIRDRLPGMNDIIDVAKLGKGRYQPYNDMKTYFQTFLYWHFTKLPGYEKAHISIDWYEPNRKRDINNIQAGGKFIMDALVEASVIKDDSQRYVVSENNNFYVDKDDPRIVINIEEVK